MTNNNHSSNLISVGKLKNYLEATGIIAPEEVDQFVDDLPDDCFATYPDIKSYLNSADANISIETLMRAVDAKNSSVEEEEEEELYICPADDPRYFFKKFDGKPELSKQERVPFDDLVLDTMRGGSKDTQQYIYSESELEKAPQEVKDHAMTLDDAVNSWSELYYYTEFDFMWLPAKTRIEDYILFSKEINSTWWTFELERENSVAYYFIDNVGGPFATGEETRNSEAQFFSGAVPMDDIEGYEFLMDVAEEITHYLFRGEL